ncbi:Mitochondrial distribution and morphology protein 10 [Venturia nashicola]|uniref:Mitochondrial distribution and morphology protein 10 n=1 Tax=Venturia nashicola TaxID=86259 RepID=A0A4Z1P401_9PEZI|nr:Mitochondrial distribution and morphology protein 10 [Venturia nashicola]
MAIFFFPCFQHSVQGRRKIVTTETYSQLEFFEQVSAASYCSENVVGPNIRLRCRTGNCPQVENAELWTVIGLTNAPNTDVTGFVAVDYTHNTTIVAFRGSESRLNWKMNFEVSLVNVDFCQNCQASQGFWKSWTESRGPIIAALTASQKLYPQNRIVVTGHSLGGAVATLAAGALRKTGFKVDLYTYGSPRVANEDLAVQLTLQAPSLGSNYRVTHLNDAVPQLPPQWFGYKHISPEYYISSGTGKNVSLSSITALPDFESHFGNYQWNRMSIPAHNWLVSREWNDCKDNGRIKQ